MYKSGVKKGLDNQAIGLLPLLLFMLMDNFFSYLLSFVIGVTSCFVCIFLYSLLSKDRIYHFMLLPSAITLVLYSIFLCLQIEPVLFKFSHIITEVLLVVTLTILGFFKPYIIKRLRNSRQPTFRKTLMRTQLNEFFFVAQIIQNVFTLHLFLILLYGVITMSGTSTPVGMFIARELNIILGVAIIVYEHIRLSLMEGSLKKEMWIPVLDNKQNVVGCIARSVSRAVKKKYFHPIVRVALLYNGMLYLEKRPKDDYVSPDTLDYPFEKYVLFRHSLEEAVTSCLGERGTIIGIPPRYLIKYIYEDNKVKHLVSLYVLSIRSEEQMEQCKRKNGKLWTTKQIEENLGKGIFSGYFEMEFPYLQNTVLLAEQFCMCKDE